MTDAIGATPTPGVIGEDEPVFVVRGRDVAAPRTIEAWATIAVAYGANPHVLDQARAWAARVRLWQQDHGQQVPAIRDS